MTSTGSSAPTRVLPSSNSKAEGDIYDFDASSESDSIQVVARPPLKKDKKRSTTTPGATRGKRRDDDAEDSDFSATATTTAPSTKKKPAAAAKKKRAKTLPTTITSLISDSEDELAAKETRTPRRSRKEVVYTIPPLTENDEEVAAKSRKTTGRSRNAVNYYIPPPPDTDEEGTPPAYRADPPRSVKNTHIMVDMTHPDLMLATQQRREYIPAVNTSTQMTNLESVQSTVPDGDMGNVEMPPLPSQLLDQSFVEPGYSAGVEEAARESRYSGAKKRSVTESALGSGLGSGFDAGSVASEWRAAKGKPNYAEVQPFEEEDDEWGAQSDGGARGKGKKGKKEVKTTTKKRTPANPRKKKKIPEVEETIVIPVGKEHEKLAELRRLENLSPASLGPHSQAQLHALRDTFKPTPPTQNTTIHVNTPQQPLAAPPMDPPATNDGFKEPEKPSLCVKLKVGQRSSTYSGTDSDTSPQRKFKRTKSRFPDGVEVMFQSPSKPTPSRKKSRPVIEDEDDVIAVAEPAAKKLKATTEDEEKQGDDQAVPAAESPARKKSKSAAKDEEEYGVEKSKPAKKTPARKKSKAAAVGEEVSIQVKPARKKSKAAAANEEKGKPVDPEPAPETAPAPRYKSRAVVSDSEEDGALSSVPPSPDKLTAPPPPPKSPTPPPVQEKPAPKRKRTKSAKEPAPTKSKKQKAKESEPEPEPQKTPTPEAPKEKEATPAVQEKDTSKEQETPNTPTKKKIEQRPAHSPIRREGKVPLRVGLSRRHRIEPLLKIVRKKP